MSHRSLNSIGGDGINTNLRASQVPICCGSTKERRRFRKNSRKLVQLLLWTFTRSEKIFLQLGFSQSCKPTISSSVSHSSDLEMYALFSHGQNNNAFYSTVHFHQSFMPLVLHITHCSLDILFPKYYLLNFLTRYDELGPHWKRSYHPFDGSE